VPWYLSIFWKNCWDNSRSVKTGKKSCHFTWRTTHIFIISHPVLHGLRNVSENIVGDIKTHILCSVTFFRKSYSLWDKVEYHCTAGHATDYNMVHAHFMLDSEGYKHALRICNTYCFSTASVVVRTCLSIMSYVHFLFKGKGQRCTGTEALYRPYGS